jgi:acyl-CoA-binding protein
MSEIKIKFEKAGEDVTKLKEKPDNKTLLKLYALYKQATIGDVKGEEPSGWDFVKKAKYDAWLELKGTPKKQAMEQYIELVEKLKNQ